MAVTQAATLSVADVLARLGTGTGGLPLLPAVVSTSLAAGSRQLARSKVLVKRLVCIEDLGDVDVLFTDKTGTLTEGSLRFMRSAGPDGTADDQPLLLGLLCNEAAAESGRAAGGNPLDIALWDSPAAAREHAALAATGGLTCCRSITSVARSRSWPRTTAATG